MSDEERFLAMLVAGGRGEALFPLARLGALAEALKQGRARAALRFTLSVAVTVVLALAGWTLFKGKVAQTWLAPWNDRVPRDVLFALSVALQFGPAAASALWAHRAWRRSSGWLPFAEVAALLSRLPHGLIGPVLVRLAIERRFTPQPEDRAVDEWLRLELELPDGVRCIVTGADHTHHRRRATRTSRLNSTNSLRTTLGCTVVVAENRNVDPASVQAPVSLHVTQADGRWSYRFEKDNRLNDSSSRLVSAGDFDTLLATALNATRQPQ